MRRRVGMLGVIAVLGVVGTGLGTAVASGTGVAPLSESSSRAVARFGRLPLERGHKPRIAPGYLRRDRTITATLLLSGRSVAEQVAGERESGRDLSKAQRAERRTSVARAQGAVADAVRASGVRVLHTMQDAVNGLVVMGNASAIERLASVPGVLAVEPSRRLTRNNSNSNAFTGVPSVWEDLGFIGTGQTIAVIDTGVDYFHAGLGGSGLTADFENNDPTVVEPGTFPTAKVVGGYDFVGDTYDAESDVIDNLIPRPDADPVDCEGHGSHVAATAAGSGVSSDGSTYAGPYTAAAVAGLRIGPGAAPGASLLAYKVFGCEGKVDDAIVVAAINRAVRDGATVINLSLGSDYGAKAGIQERAVNQASRAGVLVVAAAGNAGAAPYLVSSPSTADRALSVAALDANPTLPGVVISLTPTGTVSGQNSNESAGLPVTGGLLIVPDGAGGIGSGCNPASIPDALDGAIVVVSRGECTRVEKALTAQAKGAGAVIMVNDSSFLPPFEGPVDGLTIPFIGVVAGDAASLLNADGNPATVTAAAPVTNLLFGQTATFSSGGPRLGDSAIKPDVTAPGVAVFSVAAGSGSAGEYGSGTSTSSPHAAGVAALVRSAHPGWTVNQVKAAIMNTAVADTMGGFDPRVAGTGVISAGAALRTGAVALTDDGTNALSFGYRSENNKFAAQRTFRIQNLSPIPLTYILTTELKGADRGVSVSVSPATVTVAPGQRREITVRLSMSRASLASLPGVSLADIGDGVLLSAQGFVVAQPLELDAPIGTRPSVGHGPLRMPWLLAPRGESRVGMGELRRTGARSPDGDSWTTKVSNKGLHDGYMNLFAWQLSDRAGDAAREVDVVSVGVQSFADPTDALIVFGVNFSGTRSTAASKELDILLDTDNDNSPDFALVVLDAGLVTFGVPDGKVAAFLINTRSGELVAAYPVDAPMNGSTVEVPVFAADIGLSPASPALRYTVSSLDLLGGSVDEVSGTGSWDAWNPPVPTGGEVVAAGSTRTLVLNGIVPRVARDAGVKGYLVVTHDDPNGTEQANRVRLPR